MTKVTLTNLVILHNETTAVNAINSNNAALTTAFDNTLSRDGTAPNTMGAALDMNSNRVVNLPKAISSSEPIRVADLSGGSVISVNNLPTGGTVGQALKKNSSVDFDVSFGAFGAAAMPAFTGAVTTSAGSTVTSFQTFPAFTTLTNLTSSTAIPTTSKVDFLHAKDFGAVGDNSTDDTTALQNWITSCQTNKMVGFLDAGNYKTTAALNITAAITIIGAGRELSILRPSSTTLNCITVNTTARIAISNIQIQGPSSAGVGTSTAGASISVTAPSTSFNIDSVFRDIYFLFGFNCIDFVQAAVWTVDNIFIQNPINIGIQVADLGAGDSGDCTIVNSLLESNALGTAIKQTSAGGLRLQNNKIINWATGYNLTLSSGISTSQLNIVNNNFDTVALCISLNKGTGTLFGNIIISNNQIGGFTSFGITDDSNSGWLTNVVISGNFFTAGTSGVGIRLQNVTGFNIGGNNLVGGSGTPTAMSISSTSSNGVICGNRLDNFTTKITNSSTSVFIYNNPGYNPVGVSVASTMGASPTTVTAGASPETHYIRQSATNTATITKGANQVATLAGATTYYIVELAPFESYITTWVTTAPTFTKDIH